jgi:hypothetical protein
MFTYRYANDELEEVSTYVLEARRRLLRLDCEGRRWITAFNSTWIGSRSGFRLMTRPLYSMHTETP